MAPPLTHSLADQPAPGASDPPARPPFRPSPHDRVYAWWLTLVQPGPHRSAQQRRVLAFVGWGAALLAAGVVGWWLMRPAPAAIERLVPQASIPAGIDASAAGASDPQTPDAPVAGEPSSVPAGLVVQAAGAVNVPGVHHLPAGSRVVDLVAAAGGSAPDADLDRVNLAAPLSDGEWVWIPRRGQGDAPEVVNSTGSTAGRESGGGSGAAAADPINLNTATEAELDTLPGVGPATAAAIVAHRDTNGPFGAIDDLLAVRGIGEAKLEAIRPLVRV